jgi:small subunit ribosomal protein S21
MLPTPVGRLTFTPQRREEAINGMPGIRVKEGESFESALRRFKKKCEKAGILADLRRHQHFEKPSERRKRKLNAAKRKMMARMKVAD